jgi:hypothetical protein
MCNEFVIKKDNDCHRYKVPVEREKEFDSLLNTICETKFGSDAWYDANDNLDAEFGQYMF